MTRFLEAFDALPRGTFEADWGSRGYVVSITEFGGGRSAKLWAEEAGGADRISFNLYRLEDGTARLRPCEMPREKVVRFVEEIVPAERTARD